MEFMDLIRDIWKNIYILSYISYIIYIINVIEKWDRSGTRLSIYSWDIL